MANEKFYFEKVYKRIKFTFEEDDKLMHTLLRYLRLGKVLDLGCGEGGNALFLAEKGFKVTCVDISLIATEKIKAEAKRKKLNLNAICSDLEEYKIKGMFDVILCIGTFHFMPENKAKELLMQMRQHTAKKGLNIIISFLENDPTKGSKDMYYFGKGELKQLYADWEIIEYKEFKERDECVLHSLGRLIARRA